MAYSNGVFYVNIDTGNDGARTALTTCIASNPSGTVTRINKVGHGLVTGAVVDLTLFSAWLNDAWKITKVDNDNFDLDGAVWQTTADNNGTVTPRGGSSWSDGWLTITNGATAARIKEGDEVRVSKTADPVSIGNATWTNTSATVTLATAQTLLIDNCETAWTAVNGSTVATSTTRKQGSNSVQVIKSTSPTTSTLYAYKTLTTTDFSTYDAITLWVHAYSSNILDNNWKIALCSDTAGTVIVDQFLIPNTTAALRWNPFVLTRTGGGFLGSSIQSIALYSDTVAPLTTCGIRVDNINACSSSGLSLDTLISKSNSATYESGGWWPIQSIDGTTITLRNYVGNSVDNANVGYSGISETVISYFRKSFYSSYTKFSGFTGAANVINQPGCNFIGGWNTSSNIIDGSTYFSGFNGGGIGIIPNLRTLINNFSFVDFYVCVGLPSGINATTIKNVNITGGFFALKNYSASGAATSPFYVIVENFTINSLGPVANSIGTRSKLVNGYYLSSVASSVFSFTQDSTLIKIIFKNNTTTPVVTAQNNRNTYHALSSSFDSEVSIGNTVNFAYFKDCQFNGVTEFTSPSVNLNQKYYSQNHDLTGYEYGVTDGGTFNTEATDRVGASGKMWRLVLTNSTRIISYPLDLSVGQFAVSANNLVTVTAWMKKSHATNCDGRIRVRGYQIAGVDTDQTATLANNTDWQQLTITFTPTEAGVFEVEALAEYVAGNANVYIDQVTVTQA